MEIGILTERIKFIIVIMMFWVPYSHSQYDSINHDGIYRTFLLHFPTGYSENDTIPLVIAMHGGMGSAYNIENQSQLSVKADKENFIVVYPEGVKGGLLNVRSWNAGWCCGYASSSNTDDVGFINALVDTLINRHAIDKNRIYSTGMSNGGFMSYRLACELSDRIAAIAPVAASMSMTSCSPSRAMPIIDFHSYQDSSVPYLGGVGNGISGHYNSPLDSVHNAWAEINSCAVLNDTIIDNYQYTHIKWSSCNCKAIINFYITHDGGHSWPGGQMTPVGDSVSKYISATDLMWTFFQQYTLECKATSTKEFISDSHSIELYQNPTSRIIHIKAPGIKPEFTLILFNNLGQAVLTCYNPGTVDLTDFNTGIYHALIQTGDDIGIIRIIKME